MFVDRACPSVILPTRVPAIWRYLENGKGGPSVMSISKGWVGAVNDVIKERSPGSLLVPRFYLVCGDLQLRRCLCATTAHRAPASMCVLASPVHAMGHCKVKCSLCGVQQVWWSLH